jgi:RecX family
MCYTCAAHMQAMGYVDDEAYAQGYASAKWRSSKWAPRRIRQELRLRGISDDVIERALVWLQTVCTARTPDPPDSKHVCADANTCTNIRQQACLG